MSKIDLKKSSGLSLTYTSEGLVSPDLKFNEIVNITVDDIRAQLLNQELTSPEIFYTKVKSIDQDGVYSKKNIRLNLYLIPANLAGIEFVKTRASKVASYPRVFEVLHGAGAVLMQNFANDEDGDVVFSSVKKGQKLIVPANYSLSFVNSRPFTMILLEVVCTRARETLHLDDMGGMSYYVIRKNAKQEVVRNPVYKFVRNPRKVNWDSVCEKYSITSKTPLIKQILRKYDKFKWLFKEDSFTL